MNLSVLFDRWNNQSLAWQFLSAGGVFSLAAIVVVGALVTNLIEAAVTRNSAATTALYVDSIIAPLLPDLKTTEVLDDVTSRALDETFDQGALGGRVLSFRLWRADGTILYSTDKQTIGRRFGPSDDLMKAFSGQMVAQFDLATDDEDEDDVRRTSSKPLLEIYNPILQPWSGEVVAVSEFYEVADEFESSLARARFLSWLAVAGVISLFFLVLSAIVFRGSWTIEHQRHALTQRVTELSALLKQNKALHLRAQRASQRATALNESFLRRLGADLHDGPAQLVAYAALRIDSRLITDPGAGEHVRQEEISAIRSRLNEAMEEIRSICSGLVLPQIEAAELCEVLERVVNAHRERTGATVALTISGFTKPLPPSAKICIYRFIQETLNNGFRHAHGSEQTVHQSFEDNRIIIEVTDKGPGFDTTAIRPEGLGLAGLRERIESLGGTFDIESSPQGTSVRMSLDADEVEQAT